MTTGSPDERLDCVDIYVARLESKLVACEKELAEAKAEIREQEEQITDLNSTIGFMTEGIRQWKATAAEKDKEIERLEEACESAYDEGYDDGLKGIHL